MSKQINAIMRPLDDSDPRSLGHPSQREAWLKLAYALGRAIAVLEWNRLHGKEHRTGDIDEDSGNLREVFERPATRSLH
jgi:hypothetical protein